MARSHGYKKRRPDLFLNPADARTFRALRLLKRRNARDLVSQNKQVNVVRAFVGNHRL